MPPLQSTSCGCSVTPRAQTRHVGSQVLARVHKIVVLARPGHVSEPKSGMRGNDQPSFVPATAILEYPGAQVTNDVV